MVALARLLEEAKERISATIVEADLQRRPELVARYGSDVHRVYRRDNDYHLDFLGQALAASRPVLFADYVSWTKALLRSHGVRTEDLLINLQLLRDAIRKLLPGDHLPTIEAYIEAGIAVLPQAPDEPPSFMPVMGGQPALATTYLDALLRGKRSEASKLVFDAVEAGADLRAIYLDVFQATQREIGRLWQMNRISVAQEHFSTAATQMIMSQLYPRLLQTPRRARTLVATCVAGDLHEVGLRIVSDMFELDGWDSFYLGANAPARDVARAVRERRADVLAISATMSFHVTAVAETIDVVRRETMDHPPLILVGGRPFNIAPDLWREVGADGTATDAAEALGLAALRDADPAPRQ